jgi:hypothetical protein
VPANAFGDDDESRRLPPAPLPAEALIGGAYGIRANKPAGRWRLFPRFGFGPQ